MSDVKQEATTAAKEAWPTHARFPGWYQALEAALSAYHAVMSRDGEATAFQRGLQFSSDGLTGNEEIARLGGVIDKLKAEHKADLERAYSTRCELKERAEKAERELAELRARPAGGEWSESVAAAYASALDGDGQAGWRVRDHYRAGREVFGAPCPSVPAGVEWSPRVASDLAEGYEAMLDRVGSKSDRRQVMYETGLRQGLALCPSVPAGAGVDGKDASYWHGQYVSAEEECTQERERAEKAERELAECREQLADARAAHSFQAMQMHEHAKALEAKLAEANAELERVMQAYRDANNAHVMSLHKLDAAEAREKRLREACASTSRESSAIGVQHLSDSGLETVVGYFNRIQAALSDTAQRPVRPGDVLTGEQAKAYLLAVPGARVHHAADEGLYRARGGFVEYKRDGFPWTKDNVFNDESDGWLAGVEFVVLPPATPEPVSVPDELPTTPEKPAVTLEGLAAKAARLEAALVLSVLAASSDTPTETANDVLRLLDKQPCKTFLGKASEKALGAEGGSDV